MGGVEILVGFDSTYAPGNDVDVFEACDHVARRKADLDLLAGVGVERLRYPVRWHRIEQDEGSYDWSDTDESLAALAERGLRPIVDLLHHTSHPRWVTFADRRFGEAYQRFVEAFALRYPDTEAYTLFNEPFSTLLLSGRVAAWPPYYGDDAGMISLWRNVLPAWIEASRMYRDLLPNARHVHTDTVERHSGPGPFAAIANDRRFVVLDLMLGVDLDPERPFVRQLIEAGGAELLDLPVGHVDVIGLDYYAHNQWHWDDADRGTAPSPEPAQLCDLIVEYWTRYRRPCLLGETNLRGTATDRATWFKYTLEHCERAMAAGVPMEGHCWFPLIDTRDWDSLLRSSNGNVDPVGIYWLDDAGDRVPSVLSQSFELAAGGARSADLPAYRFGSPVDHWLRGWRNQMRHWSWQDPPPAYQAPSPLDFPENPIPLDFDPLGAMDVR